MKRSAAILFAVLAPWWLAPVAAANPGTPMSVIEDNARTLCASVGTDPTAAGLENAVNAMQARGLDVMDATYVLITSIHHTCPQHEEMLMALINPVAAEELCRPS